MPSSAWGEWDPRSGSLAELYGRSRLGWTPRSDVGACFIGLSHCPWFYQAIKAEGKGKAAGRLDRGNTSPSSPSACPLTTRSFVVENGSAQLPAGQSLTSRSSAVFTFWNRTWATPRGGRAVWPPARSPAPCQSQGMVALTYV